MTLHISHFGESMTNLLGEDQAGFLIELKQLLCTREYIQHSSGPIENWTFALVNCLFGKRSTDSVLDFLKGFFVQLQ